MTSTQSGHITFCRLTEIPVPELLDHMNDPRTARHLPLYSGPWTAADVEDFVTAKEAAWNRDGLGHQAILLGGIYAGWGGLEKMPGAPAGSWDFGLVLRPEFFGHGLRIFHRFRVDCRMDPRVSELTFLLPESRRTAALLVRLGVKFQGVRQVEGSRFRQYGLVP